VLRSTVDEVYLSSPKRRSVKEQLSQADIADYGLTALRLAIKAKKGWFALLVGRNLDYANQVGGPVIPEYVLNGIGFAAAALPDETWVRILQHRLCSWLRNQDVSRQDKEQAAKIIERVKIRELTISDALDEFSKLHYQDVRITGLANALNG
jgi:putative ATP-dependent endonuclease of OLD family